MWRVYQLRVAEAHAHGMGKQMLLVEFSFFCSAYSLYFEFDSLIDLWMRHFCVSLTLCIVNCCPDAMVAAEHCGPEGVWTGDTGL